MTTNLKPLRDYQQRINVAVTEFLIDSNKKRGQIYSPTGSGKTECFSHTIHDIPAILNKMDNMLNIAIIHPRIALSQEQLGRFKNSFGTRFHYTSFHSGGHFRGSEQIQETNTLCPSELMTIMEQSNNSHITFSSYDSFHKISHIEFDLVICDEAHNLTQDQYYGALTSMKAKKILFYTATPITKDLEEESAGMNNVLLFGDIIIRVEPVELIKKCYIVPPLMQFMKITTDQKGNEVNTTQIVAQSFKEQYIEMNKHGMPFVQMLVASRGLEDHAKIESELSTLWELIGFQVDVYVIEGSNGAHRKNGRKHASSRFDLLKEIKTSEQHAIVIHYDTLSEGIDIDTLTGACILRSMKKSKMLQTIGRCGRPYRYDMLNGEVIDPLTRKKPICVITLPIVDNEHIGGIHARSICEAFISGGYGDLSTYMSDADRKTMSKKENFFDLGDDNTDKTMSSIRSYDIERDVRKIVELGFII